MSIWLVGAAMLLFLTTFSVWRYTGLVILLVLYVGVDLVGSDAWFAKPIQNGPPTVPGMELGLTILVFLIAFDNRWLEPDRVTKLVTGGLFILGISLYGFYFPYIVEQGAYSLITLCLLLGLPLFGALVLKKIKKSE